MNPEESAKVLLDLTVDRLLKQLFQQFECPALPLVNYSRNLGLVSDLKDYNKSG